MAAAKADFLTRPPSGSEQVLGMNAYVAEPARAQPGTAVVFLSDIYGWQAPANRAFADALADAGFLTAVPDFFKGDGAPLEDMSRMPEWRERHPPAEVAADAAGVIEALRARGAVKIGAIGFCWGGLHAARLAATDLVAAAVVNHGSALTAAVVAAIQRPVQFNCAEHDHLLPLEQAKEYERILADKAAHEGLCADFKIFAGQSHGWTVRPDRGSPAALAAAEEAFERAVAFLREELQQ